MYGNFDGIKDRAKLRKEVNNLRLNRLEKLKKTSSIFIKKNTFLKISETKLQEVKTGIQEKSKKENRQQIIYYFILFLIIGASFSFIIWRYIYPFLFY